MFLDKKNWMQLNYKYNYKPRYPDMLSILINLIFVSGFCFLLIVFLEYAIYLFENQKINDLTSGILNSKDSFGSGVKRSFSANDRAPDNFNNNSHNMKINLSSNYFERSLVLVKSQNYKGWLQKIVEISKKIFNNLGYYLQKSFRYIVELSKSGNNFPDHEQRHVKSSQSTDEIKETVEKITQITNNQSTVDTINQTSSTPNLLDNLESNNEPIIINQPLARTQSPSQQQANSDDSQVATLNFAASDDKPTKDTTTYDKIEKSILAKLQQTGLNHYDIWLELGHFYQKYDEKEKAKEIFAMVMKHAQGRDKDLARDGLIALS
jgi:hypothetical protein